MSQQSSTSSFSLETAASSIPTAARVDLESLPFLISVKTVNFPSLGGYGVRIYLRDKASNEEVTFRSRRISARLSTANATRDAFKNALYDWNRRATSQDPEVLDELFDRILTPESVERLTAAEDSSAELSEIPGN